jgi:hypothetical protein
MKEQHKSAVGATKGCQPARTRSSLLEGEGTLRYLHSFWCITSTGTIREEVRNLARSRQSHEQAMKIFFWCCGLLVTLSPIMIPVWMRGGNFSALFDLQNHLLNYRDILFAIVAINAISTVEILEIFVEGKTTSISNGVLGVTFMILLGGLSYALIQIGQYAMIREAALEKLEPKKLRRDWWLILSSALCSLGLKAFGG